jgi:hypothetical protein
MYSSIFLHIQKNHGNPQTEDPVFRLGLKPENNQMLVRRAAAGGSHFESRSTIHQDGIGISSSLSLAKRYKSTSLNQISKGGPFTSTLTSVIKQSPAVEFDIQRIARHDRFL